MAELRNEKIRRGKIEFWRNDVIDKTPLSTIFKGTFEGRIEVAVKRISLDLAKLAENEIEVLLVKTDHDNVVKYYCKEQDRDFCYIAMQLCLCNLEEYVEKKGNYRSGLPNTPVEEILRGAAEGLSHIHKKEIIHRDIKPSNILLFVKENKLVAKISDFGISRVIPNHHTVSGNFSAGTDWYKAPELLTPAFSWRSDVYAFGLAVFYVLSKGKHLFNNSLGEIIKGNPVNLKKLNGQPTALSLVKWLTVFNQEERPRMSEVVHHPFFWDDEKKLDFVRDLHRITEDKKNALLIKEVIEEDSHHVICSSPKNCGNQRSPPDPAACADWTRSLTPAVKKDCPLNVNNKPCAELVRIIRNKLSHFDGLGEAVKAEYGGSIEEFRRYWLEKFPSLVVHLWEKVEITHLAALFRGYYAQESVRRTNVEKTFLKTIDEGELRNTQELQNKVKRLGSKIWEDALRSAVVKGRKEYVEVLLKDMTVTNKELLANLLLIVAREGFAEIAQLLVDHGAAVNCTNYIGETPLYLAALNGHSAVAELLIDRGVEVNCTNINIGETFLHTALRKGHSEVAKLLIERDAEINCKNYIGETPLHLATEKGNLALVTSLIEHDAQVKCKNKHGETPLHLAAYWGDLAVAQILIERGAEVNCEDNNSRATPLHKALSKVHLEVANLLVERGAEVNCKDHIEKTPLHLAADNGNIALVKFLIERGAEVNCVEVRGRTPLIEATSHGHSEVTKLLIEHGAEVNCKDKYGKTPLHTAAYYGHLAVAEILTERGAEVNCKDEYGETPLHAAASRGHSEVVKLLIEGGAEVNCKNNDGQNPLDYARKNYRTEMVELLRNVPAKNLPT